MDHLHVPAHPALNNLLFFGTFLQLKLHTRERRGRSSSSFLCALLISVWELQYYNFGFDSTPSSGLILDVYFQYLTNYQAPWWFYFNARMFRRWILLMLCLLKVINSNFPNFRNWPKPSRTEYHYHQYRSCTESYCRDSCSAGRGYFMELVRLQLSCFGGRNGDFAHFKWMGSFSDSQSFDTIFGGHGPNNTRFTDDLSAVGFWVTIQICSPSSGFKSDIPAVH